MSIFYEAVLQAVGPAEKIALFKEKVLGLVPSATSQGLSQRVDSLNYVSFHEATCGSALNANHTWPALYYLGTADPMPVDDIVIRAILVTECVHAVQMVIENSRTVYLQRSELEMSVEVAPGDSFPELVYDAEGNRDAWVQACTRFGVEQLVD